MAPKNVKNDFLNFLMSRLTSAGTGGTARAQAWQTAPVTLELLLPDNWPVGDSAISWCLRKHGSITDEGATRNLGELKEKAKDAFVLAWVPSRDVLLTHLNMPTRSRSRIEQALPYALEDILLNEPDTQHYTHLRAGADELAVAVVAREAISDWVKELNESGLPVRALLPTPLGLPFAEQTATLIQENGQLCLRTGSHDGMALMGHTKDPLPTLLKPILDEAKSRNSLSSIDIYNLDPDTDWEQWHKDLELEIQSGHQPMLSLLNPGHCPFNLMHGDYTVQQQQESRPLSQFRPAAIMAAIGFSLLISQHIIDAWQLSRENSALQKEMTSLYKKTFPDAKAIRDPVIQMQQQYNEIAGGGTGSDAFIGLLSRTTSLLKSAGTYTLTTISYNDKKLMLNINLKDYASLDQLKNKAADHGLTLDVVSANRRENQIAGRIRISGT
ncbi:MAG: type II secretion system protein GspL [Proteobacteria bacterium]|nr:type II secretion system protein GspL [Pseudomonadota bacterium]